jgi:hypothetical protein
MRLHLGMDQTITSLELSNPQWQWLMEPKVFWPKPIMESKPSWEVLFLKKLPNISKYYCCLILDLERTFGFSFLFLFYFLGLTEPLIEPNLI